jgi:outer membrane murein-binding lipoprotein Lpp
VIRSTATVLSVLLLAGCAGRGPIDTSCTAFQPITYSASQDSEPTKAQIRGHNAAYGKLCAK